MAPGPWLRTTSHCLPSSFIVVFRILIYNHTYSLKLQSPLIGWVVTLWNWLSSLILIRLCLSCVLIEYFTFHFKIILVYCKYTHSKFYIEFPAVMSNGIKSILQLEINIQFANRSIAH